MLNVGPSDSDPLSSSGKGTQAQQYMEIKVREKYVMRNKSKYLVTGNEGKVK